MLEFTFRTDKAISEIRYTIRISFNDEPIDRSGLYCCSGTAEIMPGEENKCWLDFHFYHTPDWKQVIKVRIDAPTDHFDHDELVQYAKMIACLVNQYIAQHN